MGDTSWEILREEGVSHQPGEAVVSESGNGVSWRSLAVALAVVVVVGRY